MPWSVVKLNYFFSSSVSVSVPFSSLTICSSIDSLFTFFSIFLTLSWGGAILASLRSWVLISFFSTFDSIFGKLLTTFESFLIGSFYLILNCFTFSICFWYTGFFSYPYFWTGFSGYLTARSFLALTYLVASIVFKASSFFAYFLNSGPSLPSSSDDLITRFCT